MELQATFTCVWLVCCCALFIPENVSANDWWFNDVFSRVINGEDVKKGEFPWMAMLTDGMGNQYCGGALINHRYVLTAAHCLLGHPLNHPPNLLVRLGAVRKDIKEDGIAIQSVTRIMKHPGYKNNDLVNDIALLELSDYVQFTDTVNPISLPDASPDFVGQMATVAGWGRLKPEGQTSDILQKAEISVLSEASCKELYESVHSISEDMICAGGNGKGSCQQDSGGPLMWKAANDFWYIIGVVSWGARCGEDPGVYSSVQYALPWISRTIG